jgi:hypothetical protein
MVFYQQLYRKIVMVYHIEMRVPNKMPLELETNNEYVYLPKAKYMEKIQFKKNILKEYNTQPLALS